jgi:opacity protein-like surface antigen
MKSIALLVTLLLSACAAAPSAPQEMSTADRANRISIYIGGRQLDEDDYEPVDEQVMFGIEYVRERPEDVAGFEIGLMGSEDDGDLGPFDVEGRTSEIYAGVHKSFGTDVVRPYVGAGIAYINSEVEVANVDDDDGSAAGYAHAGINFDISPSFAIGFDFRWLFASDLEIAGVDTDADYGQLAVVLGFAF